MNFLARLPRCGVICLVIVGPAVGAENFDGTYTGKRVLTKGDNPSCVQSDDVTVTVKDGTLTFTNGALNKFVIGFDPHADGSSSVIDTSTGGAVVSMSCISYDLI